MKEAILQYYLSDIVNPNNRNSIKGADVNSRIEQLRDILLQRFNWADKGHVVFLPNAYYAKKILLYFFLNKQPFDDLKIISNLKDRNQNLFAEDNLDAIFVDGWEDIEAEHFAFFSDDVIRNPNAPKAPGSESGRWLVVETVLDDSEAIRDADAFIFRAFDGLAILGFRKDMELEPIFLGSNSAEYADREGYVANQDFRRLECGTPNVPLLLAALNFYKTSIK